MSVQLRAKTAANGLAEIEANTGAIRHVAHGPDIGANGRFRAVVVSGSLVAVAAVTSSAGHLLGFRNPSTSKLVLLEKIRLAFQTNVLPSTAQEFGFAVYKGTAFTALPTGGATITTTTPQLKMRTSHAVPNATLHYANSTSALTAGTYTLNTQPLAEEHDFALVAGAAVAKNKTILELTFGTVTPLVLAQDEGIIVANAILMANSLAGTLVSALEWREVDAYPQ